MDIASLFTRLYVQRPDDHCLACARPSVTPFKVPLATLTLLFFK
jgi:hypothetical protein